MGGGAAMRAAAKAAGIGVMAGGLRAENPVMVAARNAVRPASATIAAGPGYDHQTGGGALKVEQGVQKPAWEIDDWEFAGSEVDDFVVDRIEPVASKPPRVVFGPVPTLEEAKEATSELRDALDQVYLSSPKSSGSVDSFSSVQETKACISHDTSAPKSAMQAFKLLKESPPAQTVVTSIASDPNVWNAVLQNPALVEFLESERKTAKFEGPLHSQSTEGSGDAEVELRNAKPEGLMGLIEDVKLTVVDIVNSLSNLVQSMFAVPPDSDKKPESSDGGFQRSVFAGGSFMALAMMVIMVVVMKRG